MSTYSDAVVEDTPVSYWRLQETSGATAYPTRGSSSGSYSNVTLAQAGIVRGDPGTTSVYFNGTSSYLATPGNCGAGAAPVTVEFWCKPDQEAVIGLFDSAPYQENVARNYNGDRIEWWSIAPYVTYDFLKNTVYHVVAVFMHVGGLRHIKLYINGSLSQDVAGFIANGLTVTSWRFGDINQGSAGRYQGWMQDLALYNKELSSTRVAAHYTIGNRNVFLGQTVPAEMRTILAPVVRVPLWADGEKQFYSYEAAPPFESWGRVHSYKDLGLDVCPGWVAPRASLPLAAAGWVCPGKKLPVAVRGTNGVVHEWAVLQPATGVCPHAWNVAEVVQGSDLAHTWSILIEEGQQVNHLWRVLQPGLVAARSRDVQLPYATKTITPGE